MWIILNNCTSTDIFFLNVELTICCTVNLTTTCLSPLTATRVCLIYNTPLCLHFPLLSYSHTAGSWHDYRIAQMVTSCAVCIKNLAVISLHEGPEILKILKYTNEVKGVRSRKEFSTHCAFKSAGNCRKRKQLKIFQIKQHLDPVTLTAYNLSALFTALCHQKEHIAV